MVADVGQGDDIEAVIKKAYDTGASKVVVEDLREEFLRGYVFPAVQGSVYDTSICSVLRSPVLSSPNTR